jgi:hypothetical protein
MIQIAISQAALDAIAAIGSLARWVLKTTDEHGRRVIWLPHRVLARLNALRRPGKNLQRCDSANRGAERHTLCDIAAKSGRKSFTGESDEHRAADGCWL